MQNDVEVLVQGRVVATVAPQNSHDHFSPVRYPFTYAYDLLRECRSIVPDSVRAEAIEGDNSRSNMAYLCRIWASQIGVDQLELVIGLADAFLEYHEVIAPPALVIQAALNARKGVRN